MPLESDKIIEFVEYCEKFGPEHDESYIPNNQFVTESSNPTYLLLDDSDEVIGAVSLIKEPAFLEDRKGRLRILHSIKPSIKAYKLMVDAILEHADGIDNIYMFLPEDKRSVGEIVENLGFKISRYSYILKRSMVEVSSPNFPEGFHVKLFEVGKDEVTWASIINESFARIAGHVHMTPEHVLKLREEDEYLEDGMMLLMHQHEPAGLLHVTKDVEDGKEVNFIATLAARPKYQGKGLGRNLLRMGIAFGEKLGYEKTFLSVNAENQKAVELYLNEGFKKVLVMECYNISQ
ncbi:MAG: GNAT family N-acetyltransferase [Halanaerobiales bacterium]|nr:GNAT family N-acetyltransferase [Halanaerobiales bacterium]